MQCLNIKNKEVEKLLNEYTDIFGDRNIAYYILASNNGYSLDKAPNGAESILYKSLLEHYKNRNLALKAKAKTFTPEFKNEFKDKNNQTELFVDKNVEFLSSYVLNNENIYYQKENSHSDTSNSASKNIDSKINQWLESIGVSVKAVNEIKDSNGNPINAIAKASIFQGIIEVVEGKKDETTMPEEAAHFLLELIKDSPLYDRVLNVARKSDLYKDVFNEYGLEYNNNEEKIAKETAGKLIAQEVINGYNNNNQIKSLWSKIVSYLKNLFNKNFITSDGISAIKEAADIVVNNKPTNLTLKEVQKLSNNDDYFYELSEDQVNKKNILIKKLKDNIVRYDILEGKYYKQDGTKVKFRVSDLVKSFYYKLFRNSFKESEKSSMFLAQKGTIIHKVLETLMNNLNNGKTINNYSEISSLIINELKSNPEFSDKEDSFFYLNDDQFAELRDGITEIYKNIKNNQAIINKQCGLDNTLIENQAQIFTEQLIYDEEKDRAGTIDLMVVYPNGTVGIYDYKSIKFKTVWNNKDRKREVISNTPGYKQEAYNVQVLEYKTMLSRAYGVTDFAETRVIPINVQYNKIKDSKEFNQKGFAVVEMGDKNSEDRFYLKQIPLANELTVYESLNKQLNKMFTLENKLRKQAENDPKNEDKKIKHIRIKNLISNLQLGLNIKAVYDEINNIHNQFNKRKLIPFDPDNQNNGFLSYSDLLDMMDILKTLENFAEETTPILEDQLENDENKKSIINNFERIPKVINVLKSQILDKTAEMLNKGEDFDVLDDLKKMSFWGKTFKSIHEISGGIFKRASEIIKINQNEVKENTTKFLNDLNIKHEELSNWAKANGKTLQETFDLMINKNSGSLISLYGSRFTEERNKALEKEDKKWFLKYFKIKTINGAYFYEDEIQELFDKRRSELEKKLDLQYSDEKYEGEKKRILDDFDSKYNISKNQDAIFNKNNWFMKIDKEKSIELASDEYKYILQNKPLLDYFEFIRESNIMFSKITGRDISANFIPNFRKEIIESIMTNGFAGISDMRNTVLESMAIQEEDSIVTADKIDPSTGEISTHIPLFGINKLIETLSDKEINEIKNEVLKKYKLGTSDYDEELQRLIYNKKIQKGIDNKSYDLSKSLAQFAKMAYTYQQLKDTEAQILALKELARSNKIKTVLTTSTGKEIKDKISQKVAAIMGVSKSEIELFDKFINYYWYGILTESGESSFKFGQQIDNEGNITEDGKTISTQKFVRKALQWVSLTQLGFKPLLGAYNLIQQKLNYNIIAKEKIYFDTSSINKSMNSFIKEKDKYMAAMDFFMTYSSDKIKEDSNKLSAKWSTRNMTLDKAFWFLESGDKLADRQILAAMLHYHTIKDGRIVRLSNVEGDYKSLWDSASLKEEEIIIDGLTKDELNKFRAKVQAAAISVKGIMPHEDILGVNMSIGGMLIMMYRNWIPGMVKSRFGGLDINSQTNEYEVKRFTAMWNELSKGTENKVAKLSRFVFNSLPLINVISGKYSKFDMSAAKRMYKEYIERTGDSNIDFDKFLKMYQDKLHATSYEVSIAIGLFCLVLLAKGLANAIPDDDDSFGGKMLSWAGKTNYRIIARAYTEHTFFMNPMSTSELIKSPIASFGIIETAAKAMNNGIQETIDFATNSRSKQDKSPMFYYTTKLIPFSNAVQDTFDLFDTITLNKI